MKKRTFFSKLFRENTSVLKLFGAIALRCTLTLDWTRWAELLQIAQHDHHRRVGTKSLNAPAAGIMSHCQERGWCVPSTVHWGIRGNTSARAIHSSFHYVRCTTTVKGRLLFAVISFVRHQRHTQTHTRP